MSRTIVIKMAVGVAVITALGFLFVRSALNVQSTPYTIAAGGSTPWTLAVQAPATPSGAVLVLRPPPAMASDLFDQLFSRMRESLTGPRPAAMALVLRRELDRSLSDDATPDRLLALARETGLESVTPTPQCLISRRISEPGVTRQMFAATFDVPAFEEFRRLVRERLTSPNAAEPFDPGAMSPAVLIASTDADFDSWYPIRVSQESECLAPIAVS